MFSRLQKRHTYTEFFEQFMEQLTSLLIYFICMYIIYFWLVAIETIHVYETSCYGNNQTHCVEIARGVFIKAIILVFVFIYKWFLR